LHVYNFIKYYVVFARHKAPRKVHERLRYSIDGKDRAAVRIMQSTKQYMQQFMVFERSKAYIEELTQDEFFKARFDAWDRRNGDLVRRFTNDGSTTKMCRGVLDEPPATMDQVRALDLGIFGIQKAYKKHIKPV
jgi:hypothetical protein